MNFTELNTTSTTADNIGNVVNNNFVFLYPKIKTNDVTANKTEVISHNYIIVFDSNETDAKQRNFERLSLSWYKNLNHTSSDGNLTDSTSTKNYNLNSDSVSLDTDSYSLNSGELNITIKNNNSPKVDYGVIHLNTPPFLWFSKYNEPFSFSSDSSCVSHYCIEYRYINPNSKSYDVGSGEFKGTESNNSNFRTGVKVYR